MCDLDAQPCIFCHYGGALTQQLLNNSYTFSINNVPERCDVIVYGISFFNAQPDKKDASNYRFLYLWNILSVL